MEYWADITSDGAYQVSNLGRVRGPHGILKQYEKTGGYFGLCIRGKNRFVHRLVAAAFVPNHDGLPEVNHRNCNKADNSADNLEWVSHADNIAHAVRCGRMMRAGTTSKLTASQVEEIKASNLTQCELAKVYGVSQATISRALNGKTTRFVV